MLDPARSGSPEQFRKQAEYLASINLSEVSQWEYPLKTLLRPTGRATRVIVTEYDMPRPTTEPHDVIVDAQGTVWYSDFGELFISKFDPKTLKLTEYPVKEFKPGAPVGNLSLEFDKRGTLWFDTMFQGSLGNLDPKTGEIKYYPLAPEYNDVRVQLNFVGLRHDIDGLDQERGYARGLPARPRHREMGALPAAQIIGRRTALDLPGDLGLAEQPLDGRVHQGPYRQDRCQERRGHLAHPSHRQCAGAADEY
jgi:hypothetical protein